MMIDWTFGLLFQPDIVKVGLDSETASLLREMELRDVPTGERLEVGGQTALAAVAAPLALGRSETQGIALANGPPNDADRTGGW